MGGRPSRRHTNSIRLLRRSILARHNSGKCRSWCLHGLYSLILYPCLCRRICRLYPCRSTGSLYWGHRNESDSQSPLSAHEYGYDTEIPSWHLSLQAHHHLCLYHRRDLRHFNSIQRLSRPKIHIRRFCHLYPSMGLRLYLWHYRWQHPSCEYRFCSQRGSLRNVYCHHHSSFQEGS